MKSSNVEKWRYIGWTGVILGIVVTAIDLRVKDISYGIFIPIEIIAIILIFTGLIIRKSEKTREGRER